MPVKNPIQWRHQPAKSRILKNSAAKSQRASDTKPLIPQNEFAVFSVMVADRIDVKALSHIPVLAQSPLTIRLPSGGVAVIFRYGVVVVFADAGDDYDWLLRLLKDVSSGEGDPYAMEHSKVIISLDADEGPYGPEIHIRSADKDRLQLLAESMAKSSLLSYQERRIQHDFDRVEPLAQDLADDGKFSVKSEDLLKAVGNMLLSEHRLTGRAEVREKPEALWDNPNLNGLYAKLEGDYELQERALALDRKLTTLSHTAETLVETMRHHSSHRVEVFIFLLILVELVLGMYGHIFK